MYRVKVFAELDPNGKYALKYGSDEPMEFNTYEEAHQFAEKLRNGSSLGVWFKIEKQ